MRYEPKWKEGERGKEKQTDATDTQKDKLNRSTCRKICKQIDR